jgi:hypothetical protein
VVELSPDGCRILKGAWLDPYGDQDRLVTDPASADQEPQRVFLAVAFTAGATDQVIPFFEHGLSAEYEPGKAYDITVSFTGGDTVVSPTPQNRGGFAMESTKGTLANKDDKSQVKDLGGAKRFATHTSAGNDQTSWPLTWTAPAAGSGEVTFYLATNSVNGDGLNGSGSCIDNWNKIESKVKEKPAPPPPEEPDEPTGPEEPAEPAEGDPLFKDDFEGNQTGNDSEDKDDDDGGLLPGFELGAAGAALAVAVALLRRRT